MNDTERDLRELFETKALQAGPAPRISPQVLRRGRRRQAGTVAVAGITALAVAAATVVSLQALRRTDTDPVPGGPQGNPSFTASIQNFTLTVPEGWTLIDQWPLGVSMAAGPTTTSSCVGEAIPVSDGQHDAAAEATPVPIPSPDCTKATTQTSEPSTIPEGGLPMLTLSNRDPGLGGSVCNAGGSPPATSATLHIALDYGATRTPGWERTVPSWPDPLGNVVAGDVAVGEMPCGPGGYSRFQAGGMPFIAWAGFGAEVSDADLQTVVDVFDGMRVSNAELSAPSDHTPGYVLTGAGPDWSIEVRPTEVNVDIGYREPGGSSSGVGHFGVPDVPIEFGVASGTVSGAITFDAERVELRPADGSAPVPGTILKLPGSLGAPFDAFVITSGAAGEVVAVGPDGDLGSTPTDGAGTSEPTATPSAALESSVDLPGFQGPATLTVRRDPGSGCLTIAIELANTGVGTCVNGRVQTDRPFATMEPLGGEAVVSGYVSSEAARVFLVSEDGRRFEAPILSTFEVEPAVRFFAFPAPVASGRLHIEDANGKALSDPIALGSSPSG